MRGDASGFFSKITAPVMSRSVLENIRGDLAALKGILESESSG